MKNTSIVSAEIILVYKHSIKNKGFKAISKVIVRMQYYNEKNL